MDRPLNPEEKALWGRVIATVKPLHNVRKVSESPTPAKPAPPKPMEKKAKAQPNSQTRIHSVPKPAVTPHNGGLDGSWDRRITKGAIIPDVSVDLHGQGLSNAYTRLDGALEQAIAQRARVILLVTGKARLHDRTSGEGRGAIASVVRDWLAASRHASSISAVRNAHPRHGGTGALYIILKR